MAAGVRRLLFLCVVLLAFAARAAELPADFPLIRVRPGESSSRLELLNPRSLRPGVPMRLTCVQAEARPDASHYRLTAKLSGGERIDNVTLNLALDPAALFAPPDELERRIDRVLEEAGSPVGHIFNLGHGIERNTDPEAVERLVDYVHRKTSGN